MKTKKPHAKNNGELKYCYCYLRWQIPIIFTIHKICDRNRFIWRHFLSYYANIWHLFINTFVLCVRSFFLVSGERRTTKKPFGSIWFPIVVHSFMPSAILTKYHKLPLNCFVCILCANTKMFDKHFYGEVVWIILWSFYEYSTRQYFHYKN